ncbi:MAG: hypothetical protein AB1505_00140 [Candidatus Latescibacterota bacterium]
MIDLGTRLELFVDHYLVERLAGARLELQRPVLMPPEPGRSRVCYSTVLLDDGLYRRYQRQVRPGYRGEQLDGHPGELTCYLESDDGIRWRRPSLGLVEVNGSAANNVVLAGTDMCSHNFTPFIDRNPAVRPAGRYKALGGVHVGGGLFAWHSRDGVRWRKVQAGPVITSRNFAFDSQNVAFWSTVEQQYVCYFRTWQTQHGHLRTISRCTSPDFVHWSEPVPMEPNLPGEHLYTSGTHPYFRAPHLYVALPTRFVPDRGESTDILFMTSRAGSTRFDRTFAGAFIRPGLDPARWGNRANYAAWHVVPTSAEEMSVYVSDRRYTLRTDGFAAVHAAGRGEVLTRPFTFAGGQLVLNYATSAAGSVRVEVRDALSRPLPGYALRRCLPVVGDQVERVVAWQGGSDLSALAGRPVRLRLVLEDADLYSLRFRPQS